LNVSPLALLDDASLPARMPVAARAVGGVMQEGSAYPRLVALAELHEALAHAGIVGEPRLDDVPDVDGCDWKTAADVLADWAASRLEVDVVGDNRFGALADAIEDKLNVDVLVEAHPHDPLAGAAVSDQRFPLIFVNAEQPTQRALFTLALELGHLLAGHGEPIALDDDNLAGRDDHERLVNAFAARLLMPEPAVRKVISERGRGVEALAYMTYMFGVSFQSLVFRLHNLRFINADTRNRLQAVGWHGLLRSIDRPDVQQRLGTDVRGSLVGRLGALPERRAPRWLLERTLAGYSKGVVSIRPLAGLLHQDPERLMDEVESLGPGATDILRPDVQSTVADDASDDDLFNGSPV
jgi:hypothetical protein